MMLLILNTKHLAQAADFYVKIFGVSDDAGLFLSEYTADIQIENGTSIRFRASDVASGNMEMMFSDFDVYQLHRRIKNKIPEHVGTVDDLPCGMYCGPHEYPGGAALSLRDPDGNLLSFVEW